MKLKFKNMKKATIYIFLLLFLFKGQLSAQFPDYLVNDNIGHSVPGKIVSPGAAGSNLSIIASAPVIYKSGKAVSLKPGFKATPSGIGLFNARVDFEVAVISATATIPNIKVGMYEKLELGLMLPDIINNQVNSFLSGGAGINPYNPDQISIEAVFTSPTGNNRTIYGFFYREYTRPAPSSTPINDKWAEVQTPYQWRIRFSPDYIGSNWTATIKVVSPASQFPPLQVIGINFDCISYPNNKGYLALETNNIYLKHSDGTPFFAIGMNIPYPYAYYWGYDPNTGIDHNNPILEPSITNQITNSYNSIPQRVCSPSLYKKNLDYMQNLLLNGGNYVRVGIAPWAYAIEWDKLGNYDKRQPHAWELDKVFEKAHNNGQPNQLYIQLFIEDGGKFGFNSAFGVPYYNWPDNPYNNLFNGGLTPGMVHPEDFFNISNIDGVSLYKKRLRYFMARWGYSINLGVIDFLSEPDGFGVCNLKDILDPQNAAFNVTCTAYNSAHSYQSSLTMRINVNNWLSLMIDYIKTSTSSGGLGYHNFLFGANYAGGWQNDNNLYKNNKVDIIGPHYYNDSRNINFARAADLNYYRNIQQISKPHIFGEIGPEVGDIYGCTDIDFHGSIWATALSGSFGTGLDWTMWDQNFLRDQNFPAIANFFNTAINSFHFTTSPPFSPQAYPLLTTFLNSSAFEKRSNNPPIEVFALTNNLNAIGWVHNRSNWTGNLNIFQQTNQNASCYHPKRFDPTYLNNNEDDPDMSPNPNLNSTFVLTGYTPNSNYTISWYNTRGLGGLANPGTGSSIVTANSSGDLIITTPTLGDDTTYPGDYAFMLKPQ